jgi:hypothetical protein
MRVGVNNAWKKSPSGFRFLIMQHYGGDTVCKFNMWKRGKKVSGGDLAEIITYFPECVVTLYKLASPGAAGGSRGASAAPSSAWLIGFL